MPKRNGLLFALGLSVRRARDAKQFTQEMLAERASLDPTYISGIERGLRNPGIKNVARLANHYWNKKYEGARRLPKS